MCDNCGSAMAQNAKKCPCCGSLNGRVMPEQFSKSNNTGAFKAIIFVFLIIVSIVYLININVFSNINYETPKNQIEQMHDEVIIDYDEMADYSSVIDKYRNRDVDWLSVLEELLNSEESVSEFEFEMMIIENIDYSSYYTN